MKRRSIRVASSFEEAMVGSRGAVSEQCTGKKETPPSNTRCHLFPQVAVVPVVKSASILIIVFELRLKNEGSCSFWSFMLDFWGGEWGHT